MFSGKLAEWILFSISKFLLRKSGHWKTNAAPKPKQHSKKAESEEHLAKDLFDSILKFDDFSNKTVLDLGCGNGQKTLYFASKSKKVIGVDRYPEVLEEAQKQCPSNCEFRMGKHEAIPLDDNSVDAVFCIETWEHIMHPQVMLDEIYRVIKHDGLVFIYFAPWLYPTGAHVEPFVPLPWCHVFFSEKTICNVASKINMNDDFIPPDWAIGPDGKRRKLYAYSKLTGEWLNGITEKGFRLFLAKNNNKFKRIFYKLNGLEGHTSKISFLTRPFRYLPILREYIGGFVFCVLKKI